METYENLNEEELVSLSQTGKGTPRKLNWLCRSCFTEHSLSVNIGLPENTKCDGCQKSKLCYKVVNQ